MDISTGLSALKTAAEFAKFLRDGLKSGRMKPNEVAARIGEIHDCIIDSKDALVDAKNVIQDLKNQLMQMQDDTEFRHSLQFNDSGYYFVPSRPDERYCSACLDETGKRIRLTQTSRVRHKDCGL